MAIDEASVFSVRQQVTARAARPAGGSGQQEGKIGMPFIHSIATAVIARRD